MAFSNSYAGKCRRCGGWVAKNAGMCEKDENGDYFTRHKGRSCPSVVESAPVKAVISSMTLINGNAYPVRDQLRDLGGQRDAAAKAWRVPADKADEARRIVDRAPASSPRRTSSVASTYRRRYGWGGVRGSSSYYSSGMYDEES